MPYSYLLEKTFQNRGYDQSFLDSLEKGSDHRLLHIDEMCEKLHEIRLSHMPIAMIPDFDMDGIMCGVIAMACFSELGFTGILYPTRPSSGYGIGPDVIAALLSEHSEVQAVLTADVGISCHAAVKTAKQAGLIVLVTDHHLPVKDELPAADILIDPMRADDPYEHPQICGAYVLWQVFFRYAQLYCDRYLQDQIYRLRVFAGIGTVSDSMPLLHENRPLVRDAVNVAKLIWFKGNPFVIENLGGTDLYVDIFRGLHAVISKFASEGRIQCASDIDEDFFGYYLAPMFNSVKRLDGSIERAFCAFLCGGRQADVDYLYSLNQRRKQLVSLHLQRMQDQHQPYAPYLWLNDAPGGIQGLLAQHVTAQTGLPALCVNPDAGYSGSGRSPVWYPFLTETKGTGIFAAGHEVAFGVSVHDEDGAKRIFNYLSKKVPEKLAEHPETAKKSYDFVIDCTGTDGDTGINIMLFLEYLDELKFYEPFGNGFEAPHILLKFDPKQASFFQMGSDRQHLKIKLEKGFEVLLWNDAVNRELYEGADLLCLEGKLSISEFMDMRTVSFTGSVIEAKKA